jgi:putative MATE family efflux protein
MSAAADKTPQAGKPIGARFVTGSTMSHVIIMTLTSAVGLMAMFLVDLADLWFLTLLNKIEITAAIGFAGTIVFSNLSVGLGLAIAAGALVAQKMGRGEEGDARETASAALCLSLLAGLLVAVIMCVFARPMLSLLGATGEPMELARDYMLTIAPGFMLLAGAITLAFVLRAIGDAKRSMYVTLVTAITNAVLDPVFIFGFDMGIKGAALATVCANLASFCIGLYALHRHHDFVVRPRLVSIRANVRPVMHIALPAIATQLATPFAIAYMTRVSATFGNDTVAAVAIINRFVTVAFGIIFSLSGAVGPIVGQNYGAGKLDRVRQTLKDAMAFSTVYTISVSAALYAAAGYMPAWFSATPEAASLITFYYSFIAITWAFAGAQFVAQAAFNNLERPHWSMWFNWGKATIGTIPLLHLGVWLGGEQGMLIGMGAVNVIFGLAAAITSFMLVKALSQRDGSYGNRQ